MVGTLNPASVVVDSSDDYVFTGAGRIVGTGTTLVKRGSGKLTVSNTGANTYTGLTTLQGGTLAAERRRRRTPVLNLGGADVQKRSKLLRVRRRWTALPLRFGCLAMATSTAIRGGARLQARHLC